MKYKAGDKVLIKSLDWYNENKDMHGNIDTAFFDEQRARFCGSIQTIAKEGCTLGSGVTIYAIEDAYEFIGEESIEGLVEDKTKFGTASNPIEIKSNAIGLTGERVNETKPKYEDEVNGEYYSTPKYLVRPSGYQFVDENGNVINATKIVLEKKKKEYPKTYEECYKIMGVKLSDCYIQGYKSPLLEDLQELLICRNAYWKIAGEEMGLGKPWEPNWETLDTKYDIYNYRGVISHNNFTVVDRCVLVFPTEEMRDAFYENFKELIEQCKELL